MAPPPVQNEEEEEYFHEAETRSLQAVDESNAGDNSNSKVVYPRVHMLESLVVDIFSAVSALKSAYIQLQAAHTPYDPDKLQAADMLVIVELRKLSEMKHAFRRKLKSSGSSSRNAAPSAELVLSRKVSELQNSIKEKQAVVESYERYIEACRKEISDKDEEIEQLRESNRRASSRREKLEKKVKELSNGKSVNGNFFSLSAPLFEMTAQAAREQAFDFAKVLVGLMQTAEWDLEAAANSIQPGVAYGSPLHTKFAFDSYVCHRMFNGFENENFYLSGSLSSILDPDKHRHECLLQFQDMRSVDPMELLSVTPDCLFGKFCHKKYLQVVHEKMEESFFRSHLFRTQISAGEHPRSPFYHKFLELAKCVWLLHRLAFAFNPTVSIFQVKRGTDFHPEFMESIGKDPDANFYRGKVGFTVMPGFRLEHTVVKCLVYLNRD